jgi:hypothetical protein
MSKSILSFFKKSTDSETSIESTVEPVNNVNSVDNEAPVNSVDTVHDDLSSGNRPVHSENSDLLVTYLNTVLTESFSSPNLSVESVEKPTQLICFLKLS